MERRLEKNPDGFGGALKTAGRVAAAVFLIGLNGCRHLEIVEDWRIKAVVSEVMEDQSAPMAQDSILDEVNPQPDRRFDDPGEKSDRKAEAMHRLADLYLMLEDRRHRRQFQQYKQHVGPIDHTRSRAMYERLRVLYPDRPENDRVLYQLAHVYDDEGRMEQVLSALQQLADRYPNSPFYPEAVFRLAEAYYDLHQYRRAQAAYEEVINATDADLADQAMYKLGWAHFSLQEYEKAVATFVRLADRKRVIRDNGPPPLDLQTPSATEWDEVLEIIRGMASAFSHLGPPTKIQDYFEKTGHRNYEDLVYRILGDLYMAQTRVQDAVGAYESFIKAYPLHEDAPRVQMEIVEAYQRLKWVDLANQARMNFFDRFGEESLWHQRASAVSQGKARPLHRKLVGQLALFYHSEAQQTRRPQDYERALAWYRRYLKAFPKEPDASRMNFLLAEGLYELKRDSEAVDEYERTAYDYPLHPDSAESGYAAITMLDKIMSRDGPDAASGPPARRLARNCRQFAEAFPNDPRVTDVLWKGAETYARLGDVPAARSLAEVIVKAGLPTDNASRKAQRLIARTYFEEGKYEEAATGYRRLARTGGRPEDDEELKRLWASSLYKQAETLNNAGKLREAQTEFIRVQAEVPGSDVAPVALYDGAGVALLRHAFDEALPLFQILLQRYPDHALSRKVPEALLQVERNLLTDGKVQEAQTWLENIRTIQTPSKGDLTYRPERLLADHHFEERAYERAAALYRKLAQGEASAENQEREELKRLWASALYKRAEGLKAAGKLQEAQAGFMDVQAEVPGSEVAPVALFDAGGIALSRDDQAGAIQAFAALLQDYPSSSYGTHAAIQVAKIHERNGRLQEAAQEYESAVKSSPDRKTSGEMLLAAGRLYEQLSDWAKAGTIFGVYLDQYPGEYQQVVETTFKLAWAKLQQGRRQEALPIFQTLIDRYGPGVAAASPAGYYVARAHLLKADELVTQFDDVKLISPLKKNLARKRKLLKEALEAYVQAADFNAAEVTTAATQKIGTVFEKFRTALLESERPQNLTPQQRDQYNFLLEEQAYPFEEKAIAAYESNVHRAQQLGLYDSWIRQSYDDLARLMPARYRKRERDEILHRGLTSNSPALMEFHSGYRQGLSYFDLGQLENARRVFESLVLSNPDRVEPHNALGVLFRRRGMPDEAVTEYAMAISLAESASSGRFASSELYNNLAIAYREHGAFKKAEEAYRKAITLNPDFSTAYYNLGVLYDLYLDRPLEAMRCYREYQKRAGPDPAVDVWITDLEQRTARGTGHAVDQPSH
ncbi:MAG: tetratricopeptide repeat protein [Nitrospirota bacterium]